MNESKPLTREQIEMRRQDMLGDVNTLLRQEEYDEECADINLLCDMALSSLQSDSREGWVSVPTEPTTEMVHAAWDVVYKRGVTSIGQLSCRDIYYAMIAAAPGDTK